MSLPRYPKYKDSGVAWLGEVPEHWEPKKIGTISSLKGRLGWQGLKADEYRDDGPYVVSSAHFEDHRVDWDACPRVSQERYDTDTNIQLAPGDLLLMKDGAAMGKLAFVENLPGPACLNSHLLLFRPIPGVGGQASYLPKFAFYFMQTGLFQEHIRVHGTGATFLGVSQATVSRYQICLPPLPEQAAIAAFLDRETTKIDGLVAEQERLIELLKEKRQAVISHAVTKGMNPKVPMKASGVEWLGGVPAHWEECPLKALFSLKHGYAFESEAFSDSGEHVLMTPGHFHERGGFRPRASEKFYVGRDIPPEFILRSGQMLVAMTEQAPGLLGSALFVPEGMSYLHNQRLGLVRNLLTERLRPDFLFHLLNSDRLRAEISVSSTGAKVKHTSPDRILSIKVFVPPLSEQARIADALDRQAAGFDALEAAAGETIDLLQERRTALISAAVTGQIDVRKASGKAA